MTPAQTAHTPGPWTFHPYLWDGRYGHKEQVITTGHTPPKFIGSVPVEIEGELCPEGQANARLIAAAPDLLAACEQCAEWADLIAQNYPDMAGLLRGLQAARAAIAQAKEQP